VFSLPENILLKWLQLHHNQVYFETCHPFSGFLICTLKTLRKQVFPSNPRRITNFTTDLRDGVVLCAVIRSHVPNIKALQGLHPSPHVFASTATAAVTTSSSDPPSAAEESLSRENSRKLLAALAELGLRWPSLQQNDRLLARPTARALALLVLYLYQTLPAFVAKASIEFSGRLADAVVKTIELTNPTKKVRVLKTSGFKK
jgi:hypothetical protein